MSDDTEFLNELPSMGRGRPEDPLYAAFADTLREHPKQWAPWPKELMKSSKYRTAHSITLGHTHAPPSLRDGFEAAVRQGVLYARYIGEDVS